MAASSLVARLSGPPLSARLFRFRYNNVRRTFASIKTPSSLFAPLDAFPERHIGPDDREATKMLQHLGYGSMDEFVGATVPSKIRLYSASMNNETIPAYSELELNRRAKELGLNNKAFKSYIGMGYHNAVVPTVILRNVSFFH